jgi:hypothetical protein
MKNINSIFGLILTLISFNSCKTEVPVLHQKILFEQHYVNYAWSYQNSGYLVDSLGYVRVFNLSKYTNIQIMKQQIYKTTNIQIMK